ncbi:MAG: helix-turn-helix domain-containing protein [Candidatus Symbiothrix sp.]|jgi:DNA-binding Xre family transcriptional regulator|nr:helix-turn-helix domain-containing protein [Candidatus Symbiothrix sp.]
MSEISKIQLNNFNRLLMEKGLTKRQLAEHIGVHENGMNRILSSPDIKLKRLTPIAEFLDMEVSALLKLVYESKMQEQALIQESEKTAIHTDISVKGEPSDSVNDYATKEATIILLSENLKLQKQTAELLQQNGERLQQLMDLFISK